MRTLTATALCAAALALAGCGSSGGDEAAAAPLTGEQVQSVPASAWASPGALVSYSGDLAASEASEPLDVDTGAAPTSEDTEPQDI